MRIQWVRRTAARAGVLASLLAHAACSSDVDDPSAIPDIRIHDLRSAVQGAPAPPRSIEEVLRLLPPQRREELRRDGYGSAIQYTVQGRRHEFRSPGADRVPNTADDYVLADSLQGG